MAAPLATEMGLGADDLGLLTSVYILTFAAQIPIGILLDRYGPWPVQSVLLMVAAVGSTLFAVSDHFLMLLVGRALMGLGVTSAMTGGSRAAPGRFDGDARCAGGGDGDTTSRPIGRLHRLA
jgi:MFS family permease